MVWSRRHGETAFTVPLFGEFMKRQMPKLEAPKSRRVICFTTMGRELTDQAGKTIRLSGLRGKVVALTFGYSRCPFPDYCLRLSNNLGSLQKRFEPRAGRDLVLITIAIDPEHDQGNVLSDYAASFHADQTDWHFLTGPLPEVKQVAGSFGMNFWGNEGLLTRSLHTAVLDRNGILVANIEGNHFTAQQLGDLVENVMNGPR